MEWDESADQLDVTGSFDVTGNSSFNGDVTFTGASYNAVWDKSDNALEFGDNAEARFGAVGDLRIFHASGSSVIRDGQSNPIFIQTDNTVHLTKNVNSETMAKFIGDGAVELYHNNIKKIETTSTGILLESTDDGTAAAPIIELYRHSASPDSSDDLGAIEFHGEDDNDDKLKYAQIRGGIFHPTDTNERGYLYLDVMQNGNMTNFIQLGGNTANFSKPAKFNSGFHLQNTDTTFARESAGVASIEGNTILTTANADVGTTTTSSSDADHVLIDDGGVLKKITPANLGISGGGITTGKAIAMAMVFG
jgi:hypothetical protein